jgi:hypothetical protein
MDSVVRYDSTGYPLVFTDTDGDGLTDSIKEPPVIDGIEVWEYMQAWGEWFRSVMDYIGEKFVENVELAEYRRENGIGGDGYHHSPE